MHEEEIKTCYLCCILYVLTSVAVYQAHLYSERLVTKWWSINLQNMHNDFVTTEARWPGWRGARGLSAVCVPSCPRQTVRGFRAATPPPLRVFWRCLRPRAPCVAAVSPFQITTHWDEICRSVNANQAATLYTWAFQANGGNQGARGPDGSEEQIVALLATCCMCCSGRKRQQVTVDVCAPLVLRPRLHHHHHNHPRVLLDSILSWKKMLRFTWKRFFNTFFSDSKIYE